MANFLKIFQIILNLGLTIILIAYMVVQGEFAVYSFSKVPDFKNFFCVCFVANGLLTLAYPIAWLVATPIQFIKNKIIQAQQNDGEKESIIEPVGNIQDAMNENVDYIKIDDGSSRSSSDEPNKNNDDGDEDIEEATGASNEKKKKKTIQRIKDRWNKIPALMQDVISGFVLSPLYLFSAYTWYMSMDYILVSLNIALYQSSIIYVFIFSLVLIPRERQWWPIKGILMLITLGGFICVGVGGFLDSNHVDFDVKGYIFGVGMVCFSGFLFAIYSVLFNLFYGEATILRAMRVTSLIGLTTLLFYWVFIVIFHFTFEPIPTKDIGNFFFIAFSNGGLALGYFLLLELTIFASSSAVYLTFATMISLPVAAVVDYIIYNAVPGWLTILGFVIVFFGSCMNPILWTIQKALVLLRRKK